jgi:hypothetical protein
VTKVSEPIKRELPGCIARRHIVVELHPSFVRTEAGGQLVQGLDEIPVEAVGVKRVAPVVGAGRDELQAVRTVGPI